MEHIYWRSIPASDFKITNLKDAKIFINLMESYEFLGAKALYYADFYKGLCLITKIFHFIEEGLAEIKQIVDGMNSRRTNFIS